MDAPFVPLGRVVKAHGLNGEVSVAPAAGPPFLMPDDLLDLPVGLEVWFVPPPASIRSARVRSVRRGPKGPLVSLEGVGSIDAASSLRGATIMARPADLPEEWLEEAEPDILGYEVVDEVRGGLGIIEDTIVTGANDVWVVQGGYGEVLVPVIDDVVLDIDDDTRVVRVRVMPGLIGEE